MTRDPTPVAFCGVGRVGDPGPSPSQSAQRIWRRASSVTGVLDEHDLLAVVLELLRAARHDVGILSEALRLGRRRACEHQCDEGIEGGLRFLEHALAFMGVELPEGR
jgi:hypothetical protein